MGTKRVGLARTQALIQNLKRELDMNNATLVNTKGVELVKYTAAVAVPVWHFLGRRRAYPCCSGKQHRFRYCKRCFSERVSGQSPTRIRRSNCFHASSSYVLGFSANDLHGCYYRRSRSYRCQRRGEHVR